MNAELKKAFKTLSDYCIAHHNDKCPYSNVDCEIRLFCQEIESDYFCCNISDWYEAFVEEEGL